MRAWFMSEYTRMTQESPRVVVFLFLNQCVAVELWIVSPGGGELLPGMFFVHPEH